MGLGPRRDVAPSANCEALRDGETRDTSIGLRRRPTRRSATGLLFARESTIGLSEPPAANDTPGRKTNTLKLSVRRFVYMQRGRSIGRFDSLLSFASPFSLLIGLRLFPSFRQSAFVTLQLPAICFHRQTRPPPRLHQRNTDVPPMYHSRIEPQMYPSLWPACRTNGPTLPKSRQ